MMKYFTSYCCVQVLPTAIRDHVTFAQCVICVHAGIDGLIFIYLTLPDIDLAGDRYNSRRIPATMFRVAFAVN